MTPISTKQRSPLEVFPTRQYPEYHFFTSHPRPRPSVTEPRDLKLCGCGSWKKLVATRANVNKPDDQGQTPLHHAAVSRSSELTRILVEAGTLLDEVDEDGQTPPIAATEIKAEGRAEILDSKSVSCWSKLVRTSTLWTDKV